jgi:hypothetical protein
VRLPQADLGDSYARRDLDAWADQLLSGAAKAAWSMHGEDRGAAGPSRGAAGEDAPQKNASRSR